MILVFEKKLYINAQIKSTELLLDHIEYARTYKPIFVFKYLDNNSENYVPIQFSRNDEDEDKILENVLFDYNNNLNKNSSLNLFEIKVLPLLIANNWQNILLQIYLNTDLINVYNNKSVGLNYIHLYKSLRKNSFSIDIKNRSFLPNVLNESFLPNSLNEFKIKLYDYQKKINTTNDRH